MIYTIVTDRYNVRVIKLLISEIMFHNYEQVFNKIKNSISDEACRIVLDMEKITFMDSLSTGMLVPLLLYTKRLDGDLALINLKPEIKKLFTALRLDKIIRVYDDLNAAIGSFEVEAEET